MRWISKALFILIIITSHWVQAGEREAYLRRASMLIRGVPPSTEEYKAVSAASDSDYGKVLESLLDSYLKSPLFPEKMRLRVGELFKMRAYPSDMDGLFSLEEFTKDSVEREVFPRTSEGAFDELIRKVAGENLSWNELLTSKTYPLLLKDSYSERELDFYENVFRVKDLYGKRGPFELGSSRLVHPQSIAGLLTTPRFFERYYSASDDRNRQRAAIILEALLCRPSVSAETATKKDLSVRQREMREALNLAPAPKDQAAENDLSVSSLDRLAAVFDFSSVQPSPHSRKGELVYDKTNIPFRNISDLAKILVDTPDFKRCQAQHFWNWFMGSDVPIKDREAFEKTFDQVGRKPKDFVKYIFLKMAPPRSPKKKSNESASFEHRYDRALEYFDLFETLQSQFQIDKKDLHKCRINRINMRSLGFIDPASGKRGSSKPSIGYYNFVYSCLNSLITESLPIFASYSNETSWSSLPEDRRGRFAAEITEKIIGAGVLSPQDARTLQLETLMPALKKELAKIPDLSVRKAMVRVTILTMMNPAFLTL